MCPAAEGAGQGGLTRKYFVYWGQINNIWRKKARRWGMAAMFKQAQPALPGKTAWTGRPGSFRVYSRSHWPRGRENKSSDSGKNQPGRTAPPPVFPCAPALFSLRGYGSRYASYSRSGWAHGRAAFAAPQVKPSPTARALGFYLRSAPSVPMRLPPRYAMNWDGRPARWTGAAPALAASCKTPSGDSWAPAVQSRPCPAS